MMKVSLLATFPEPVNLVRLLRKFILWLFCTVTEYCLHLSSILVILSLVEIVQHEVLFLNAFNEDVIIVHEGLEGLRPLQYSLILRRRAVGILRNHCLLLNIDDIGRNVSKRSIAFLKVWSHIICKLERAGVA